MTRELDSIIVHMSYTTPTMDIGVEDIRRWHVEGNGWRDIGYHWVIKRDGSIEQGRPIEQPGAHVAGHNEDSIGVCLVGGKVQGEDEWEFNFTYSQIKSLQHLLIQLSGSYSIPIDQIYGHRDFSDKQCPGFDIHELLKGMEDE